eukprot:8149090-Alexandrium_andersonii.AAC.1
MPRVASRCHAWLQDSMRGFKMPCVSAKCHAWPQDEARVGYMGLGPRVSSRLASRVLNFEQLPCTPSSCTSPDPSMSSRSPR